MPAATLGAPPATRLCTTCETVKPFPDEFAKVRHGRWGRGHRCLDCHREYKRAAHHRHRLGARVEVEPFERAPDPVPAQRLRELLRRFRDRGWPFERAWTIAVGFAVANESRNEQTSWRAVFEETRGAWQMAYSGEGHTVMRGLVEVMDA
jgi:hypothetical protein